MESAEFRHIVNGYLINKNGEVYSSKSRKMLKQFPNSSGYMRFQIYVNGVRKWFFTHITVVNKFGDKNGSNILPDRTLSEMGWSIDHIDGDKLNNNQDNLEIVTHATNVRRYRQREE